MESWEELVLNKQLQEFNSFEDKYDYVACFDENGSASATLQMFKAVMSGQEPDENRRYFTLTCCLFSKDEYEFSKSVLEKLKKQYFKNHKGPIVLHTRDIIKRIGAFNFKTQEKQEKFINSLSNAMHLIQCKIISVTFDLYSYVKQDYKYDPYEVAFDIILKGLCKNVGFDEKIALVFESRGKNEDKTLYKHIYKILNITGCKDMKKNILRKHYDEAYFNHKISSNGQVAYPGIEIADLCSYPIYRKMRFGTKGKDFIEIKDKIVVGKNGIMYGLRKFPNKWIKK